MMLICSSNMIGSESSISFLIGQIRQHHYSKRIFLHLQVGRRLRIQRTFKTSDGKQFVRIEVVKNQAVIDAYLKLNKDKNVK